VNIKEHGSRRTDYYWERARRIGVTYVCRAVSQKKLMTEAMSMEDL